MAYVNVAEWKTDLVCEWLKGLDNSVLPYVHSFSNHNVNGQQLLNLRPEDLDHLGVSKLGHQEIILEAVEYLRNFHYELDRENLQLLSLRLSCLTHSLFNELSKQTDSQPVATQSLADVASIVSAVKPLVCWLDRPPFSGQLEYNDKKAELLKLSLEMATCAQRDRFAEKPIEEIRTTCGQMAKIADYFVQDIADPMILQPASLDLATLKKRPGDDLGFYILPSFHGAHQIAEIKFGSAAHQCGKMEEGDEIVQVNYQTVVGWERKNVLELFRESPAEVLLTLKRRPRHTKVYGQIYIKPYRLPSNKKTPYTSRWHHNLPSPRPELLTIPDFTMPLPRNVPKDNTILRTAMLDTEDMLMVTDSSDSDCEFEAPSSVRLYLAKPRNPVQRRATITGASPTSKHGVDIERFWRELKQEHSTSFQFRDKAASCAHGLNNVQANLRPQTCLGIEQRKKRHSRIDEKKVHFEGETSENDKEIEEEKEKRIQIENENEGENKNLEKETIDSCDVKVPLESNIESKNEEEPRKERGKLDKSHSTPAYDLNSEEEIPIFKIQSKSQKVHLSNEKLNKTEEENVAKFRDSGEVKILVGSVVKKINDFEKHLMKSNEKIYSPKVPTKKRPKSENQNTSTSSEDSFCKSEKNSQEEKNSRESSEDKSESSNSYLEDEVLKFSNVLVVAPENEERKSEEKEEIVEADSENKIDVTTEPKAEKQEIVNKISRPEVKPRLSPPEPPPRKYFSKPPALNLNHSEHQERPKVPERPSVKKEVSDQRKSDRFENSEFMEKSADLIEEPSTPDFKNPPMDSYGYSQIYDPYSQEEKVLPDRNESFIEKFSNHSFNDPRILNLSDSRSTTDSRSSIERQDILHLDFPDGAGCSKQTLEKPRTLEKERGVVNRAMMVARSIGLHTSSKTVASPKSSRKRNLALAKRRNVSAKEISPGDLESWLTYRSRGAGGAWAKAWFVLKGASLFRFKNQEGSKADCLIALTGFTASQASEVKSRKHAFKIYHTGTVFYFAADTEDLLLTWLDAVSKTTLGVDTVDRSSGLFSETDESDGEGKGKVKSPEVLGSRDKGFGSLKKGGKKDSSFKEQSLPAGASLDRKYLKFLGKSQNVPVPTAQFRSYRRVLPNSTSNRKQETVPHSPELPVTVAGSTFYGLNASRSANDVPSSTQDMGDYRRTSDRFPRTRRNDELQGFITLEEFMLVRQNKDHQRGTPSPRFTPLTGDHVHIQHRTFDNLESARMRFVRDMPNNNGVIYGFPKNYDESSSTSGSSYGMQTPSHTFERRTSERSRETRETRESSESKGSTPRTLNCMRKKKSPEEAYYDSRKDNMSNLDHQNETNTPRRGAHGQINPADYGCEYIGTEFPTDRNHLPEIRFSQRRTAKNDVYFGSSGDLACHASSDILQVPRALVSRNGSFNLADCRRDRIQDKKICRFDKNKLKHVAQYQPPPIPNSPFEQEGMRAAFEMHLDKGEHVHKTNKLKNFFSNKSPQKPNALEIPKEQQKTLLGSPRLHRALFRDKSSIQPKMKRSGSQSPGDSGISQSLSSGSASQSQTLSQSFSSVSSASDWSPDGPGPRGSKSSTSNGGGHKRPLNSRNFTSPPSLPYIPPPTSPPPDYPGLEYPPVFEPGTYSLSDASILRSRSKNS